MKSAEFKETMSVLGVYYPSANISDETLKAYWMKFKDKDLDEFSAACNKAVEETDFFPTVHQIIKNMSITFDEVVSELRGVIKIRPGESFSRESLSPVTLQVLDELGGKYGIGQMSEDKLQMRVRMIYKYAGIVDEKPKIGRRNVRLGEVIKEPS